MARNKPVDLSEILMLVVDGRPPIRIRKADGGVTKHSLIDDGFGAGTGRIKHAAAHEIEPLTIEVGGGSREILKWASDALRKTNARRNVALYRANANGTANFELDGYNALLIELTLPRLQRGTKTTAFVTAKLQFERTSSRKIADQKTQWPARPMKGFSGGTFALTIDGLTLPAKAVAAVEALTIKLGIKKLYTGQDRFPTLAPTKVETPTLRLAIDRKDAAALVEWHDDVARQRTAQSQKTGAITYYGANGKTAAFSLNLYEIMPVSVSPARNAGPTKVDLACGRMELDFANSGFE